jgi:sugar O-acyltransferase (sialic acid O-acetyltransferase NeuD family)
MAVIWQSEMKNIYIVGAGSFARETRIWLKDWLRSNLGWQLAGFIADDSTALDKFPGLPPIVGAIDDYQPAPDSYHICAIAKPQDRKRVVEKMLARGAEFISMIHPTAIVAENAALGQGIIVCPNVVISTDSVIGDFVNINIATSIGHDVVLGAYSTLSSHCDITGGASTEECAFLGSHAVVLPKVKVGSHAVVGAGSVAMRAVKAGSTVFGVPAKKISG